MDGLGEACPAIAGGTEWVLGGLCCWFAGKVLGDGDVEFTLTPTLSSPGDYEWLAHS